MPTIQTLYGGDGTQYTVSSAGITEDTAVGNNLLKPFDSPTKFYFDFTDGATRISHGGCYCTASKIYVAEATKLYVLLKEAITSNHTCAIYCYHNDEYLGYNLISLADTKVSVALKDGTNYVRLYLGVPGGVSAIAGDNFCISKIELDAFEDYMGEDKLMREYVPMMSESDTLYPETLKAVKHNPVHGDNIILFGDSIPGPIGAEGNTASLISGLTGANITSCAIGGAAMGERTNGGIYNAWSMHRLADAIVSKDWSLQEENISRTFEQTTLDFLKATDFAKIDSIIIMYGYNDASVDNAEDTHDVYTMGGALRHTIETILAAYPNIRIFPCTLTFNQNVPNSTVHAEKAQKIRDIAAEYHLKCIDLFDIGINSENASHYFPAGDTVHLNASGKKVVAKKVARELF